MLVKKQPPEGRRLLVLGTSSAPQVMADMGVADAFNVALHVPALREAEIASVLKALHAIEPGEVRAFRPAPKGLRVFRLDTCQGQSAFRLELHPPKRRSACASLHGDACLLLPDDAHKGYFRCSVTKSQQTGAMHCALRNRAALRGSQAHPLLQLRAACGACPRATLVCRTRIRA